MRFAKFSPYAVQLNYTRASSSETRGRRRSRAYQVFYESTSKYVSFRVKGAAKGSLGNRYKMILRNMDTDKFRIRVWDETDTLLGVVNTTEGMAGMAAAIAGSSDLSPIISVAVTGTISVDQQFSAGTGVGSATTFRGGA
tara:strand:- start:364 stop:783 length:420 start_codon:yes stop_codon:yes gene_type:complete